jgi:hypothetical protein
MPVALQQSVRSGERFRTTSGLDRTTVSNRLPAQAKSYGNNKSATLYATERLTEILSRLATCVKLDLFDNDNGGEDG